MIIIGHLECTRPFSVLQTFPKCSLCHPHSATTLSPPCLLPPNPAFFFSFFQSLPFRCKTRRKQKLKRLPALPPTYLVEVHWDSFSDCASKKRPHWRAVFARFVWSQRSVVERAQDSCTIILVLLLCSCGSVDESLTLPKAKCSNL